MDSRYCTRCGKKRGERWESGDAHCGGSIFLTACSQIHDAITGTRTGKINSPFYIDSGFQSGAFRWGKDGDAKLCWDCNRALLRHIGKFFLSDNGPAPKEKEMEPDKYCHEHKYYCAPNEGCEKCVTDLRAVWERAYFAALTGVCADPKVIDVADEAALAANATVSAWPAMTAERDALIRKAVDA